MRLTKFGHSCLLVETADARLLIDPGRFSSGYENLGDLTGVLITHQHSDHLDPEPLGRVLANNPGALVLCDPGSVDQLSKLGAAPTTVEAGTSYEPGVTVTAYGNTHAVIHPDIPLVENVGYLIEGRLFHPGDALTVPPVAVELLALPTVAPWMSAREAVDYLREVSPKVAVPIHEAVTSVPSMYYKYFQSLGPSETTVQIIDDAGAVSL